MLASYIRAVLCSLIASFIDVLSLTVQCRPCSFGEALHYDVIKTWPNIVQSVLSPRAALWTHSAMYIVTYASSLSKPKLQSLAISMVTALIKIKCF